MNCTLFISFDKQTNKQKYGLCEMEYVYRFLKKKMSLYVSI